MIEKYSLSIDVGVFSMSFIGYTFIPFILILSILVFIHELGHYLIARWNGVKVEVFSIGFGSEIYGWTDKKGTRWKISLLPLGGYVKMFSDLNPASQPDQKLIQEMSEEDKKVSLFHKSVWQRIGVSAAGPIANYLFAILLFGTLYIFVGQKIPAETSKIGQVVPKSIAEKVGLKSGDLVLAVNETPIQSFSELQKIIQVNPGREIKLYVQRDNQNFTVKAIPQSINTGSHPIGRLGITPSFNEVKRSALTAYFYAVYDAYDFSVKTLSHLGKMIIGEHSTENLSGPLGIASLTGEVARKGFIDLIWLTALLSINLGLINLLPIPMLDGGHLLFYFIEAVRGKPVSDKLQEWGYRVGFGFIMLLMLISTWNDLSNLKVFEFFKNIFN
jgi:regulator of sigma E protease